VAAIIQSAFGLLALASIAWITSENRRAVSVRDAGAGILLQLLIGAVLIKFPGSQTVLVALNHVVGALERATLAGTAFVFGYLGGGTAPFEVAHPGSSFVLAFQALPLVLVISAISAVLFHWGILPRIVQVFAFVLRRILRIGGPLGVVVSSNIFLGMTESPLLIRPYLASLTRSELFVLMTCSMAMIAGTVMVVYAVFLQGVVPNPIGQLLTASLISAPASIVVGRLMIPETETKTPGGIVVPDEYRSTIDAIVKGTVDGLQILLAIVPMLIVLVALVALANEALGVLPHLGGAPVTLQRMLGIVMSPVAWLMGVPWREASTAGQLLGTKIVLNEFIAYLDFAKLPADALDARSKLIVTFALCSFANFGSLGIMIGTLGTLVPERRNEVVALGPRAILSGTIASCMTGATAGLLAG
jgi:CNT family concentrative nucleoside transporter